MRPEAALRIKSEPTMQGAKRSITSRVTIKNPRPRKYASAAEKQAAFRARFPTICVRVEPKTAETVQAIADASGRTQQETLLSMLKYAMTNRNWLTLGLTEHKQLPRIEEPRKENPMKRKPTPAQIAARERFAAMARSGAFKKKAAKARKKNPLTYGLDGVVNITDTYERSVTSSRNLAEHYANQLRMRGRDDIVYVVFGITPEAKAQAGRYRNGVTITLEPRDYEIAYAFHPTQGEISRQLKAQRDAERRAFTRQGMKLKSNPRASNPIILVSDKAIATKRKRNPINALSIKYACIMPEPGGMAYGIDERTPVTIRFSASELKRAYKCYLIPANVRESAGYKRLIAKQKEVYMSLAELKQLFRSFV